MDDCQKILQIIQDENNLKIANNYKKDFSNELLNILSLNIKKEPCLVYDYLFVIQRDIENSFPVENRTFPPLLMRSLLYSFYFVLPFLFLICSLMQLMIFNDFEKIISSLISAYFTFLVAIFVYLYVTFNNKWKYLADLFNKIYYDNYKNDHPLEHLRKKLIFAQDIYDLNMTRNKSFEHNFYCTLTISAFIYDELLNKEKVGIYRIYENKIEFLESPRNILEKVTSFVIKNTQTNDFQEYESSSKNLLSLTEEINSINQRYKNVLGEFQKLESKCDKLRSKLEEFLIEKQTKMNKSGSNKKKNHP